MCSLAPNSCDNNLALLQLGPGMFWLSKAVSNKQLLFISSDLSPHGQACVMVVMILRDYTDTVDSQLRQ